MNMCLTVKFVFVIIQFIMMCASTALSLSAVFIRIRDRVLVDMVVSHLAPIGPVQYLYTLVN